MRLHRHSPAASIRHALVALLVLAALLSLGGCTTEQSADVNQQRIWTSYELEYDANSDVTTAKASFRFGSSLGTPLELTNPSEVRFNGDRLARVAQPGTGLVTYERTYAGLVSSGTFRFVDVEGEAYSNTAAARPVEFPAALGPIDNDASYAFDWVGSALAANEQVQVTLWRLSGGTASLAVFPQSQDGARGVIMDALQLRNVAPGAVSLRMERTWTTTPTRTPDAGGRLQVKWVAREKAVEIVD